MRSIILAGCLALTSTPVLAQDVTSALAAYTDQTAQAFGEAVRGTEGLFVTAQGKAPLSGGVEPRTLTLQISGKGDTAAEAAAERDQILKAVQTAARRAGVTAEVGEITYSFGEANPFAAIAGVEWPEGGAEAEAAAAGDNAVAAAGEDQAEDEPAIEISTAVEVKVGRPDEARMPAFVDALAASGVKTLNEDPSAASLGPLGPLLALFGLSAQEPSDAVWAAATDDALAKARTQAEAAARASGRRLGPARNISILLRSSDGKNAVVTVAVRYGFSG